MTLESLLIQIWASSSKLLFHLCCFTDELTLADLLQRIVGYLDKWKQAGKSRVGRIEILLVIAKTNPEFVVLDLEGNSGILTRNMRSMH
jgi:hypothetical protein